MQHAELGPVGDLEEGERTAALLPLGSDLAANDYTLAEEVVQARGRVSSKSLSTIARPHTHTVDVTPPSRNDGVNQDHIEGFSAK
jgi:hypothetical protein